MVDLQKAPQPDPEREPTGCLTTVIRIPVRIVVLVVVLPLRLVWDALTACGRAARRLTAGAGRLLSTYLLVPLGYVIRFLAMTLFVWSWVGLYRYLLTPLGHGVGWLARYLVAVPAAWLYRWVLTPSGHGIGALGRCCGVVLGWLGRALLVWPSVGLWRFVLVPLVRYGMVVPAVWVYRQLLTPAGHGLARFMRWTARGTGLVLAALGRWLLVVPAVALWRFVLTPVGRALRVVGREVLDAIGFAWRVAGHISRAAGRALKWLARNLLGRPARWVWQGVVAPVASWVHGHILRPAGRAAAEAGRSARAALRSARETVRQVRRDAWRAMVGGARPSEVREPDVAAARTLGVTTTVPDAAPGPEISLLGDKTAEPG
ncbi:hypothetical protein AB0436_03885 [Streptomyces sp. NPDC051322]|uniref:hypothetical protein n=1 Tax=Streptomyces sp. NPDC051322 TaxID=3154645 RepID=UPI00344F93B6